MEWVQRSGISPVDAEDVAQEVFLAAAKGIEKYRHENTVDGSFRRWLWGITRHRLQRHFSHLKDAPRGVGGTDAVHVAEELARTAI